MIQPSRSQTKRRASARRPGAFRLEHDIGDSLSGAVIGVAPAPPGFVHGQPAGVEEFVGGRADAAGIERRVFEQPDEFARAAAADGGDALFHRRDRESVVHRPRGGSPFDSPHGGRVTRAARLRVASRAGICYGPGAPAGGNAGAGAVVAEMVDAQR